ncbi:MAG: hypothetical protein V4671_31825 [Armatimonadota bacterium]
MRPTPQRSSRVCAALCAMGLLLLVAIPLLGSKSKSATSAPSNLFRSDISTTDEPQGLLGDDHWTDAHLARRLMSDWLTESPGTPTLTVSRKDVVWVRALVESAARQAEAQRETSHPQTN